MESATARSVDVPMPSSGAIPSSRSSLFSHEYTKQEGHCFLALLLISSETLYFTPPPPQPYSHSSSVPLMTSHYVPPINDRNWKERRGQGRGHFSKCFSHRKQYPKLTKISTCSTLSIEFNYELKEKIYIIFSRPSFNILHDVSELSECCNSSTSRY